MARVPTPWIDYTSRDYDGYRSLLIYELQKRMPEYTDISSTDAGIVILECLANGLDVLSLYNDYIANDMLLPTTQDRKIATIIANMLGYRPKDQTAAQIQQVFVLTAAQDQPVVIPKGTIVRTMDDVDVESIYFETTEDFRIPAGKLGNETDDNGNYIYMVIVEQGETIEDDVLGSSDGTPYQQFQLSYDEALPDTIELMVADIEGEYETWERVDNFVDSDETSNHYTVSTNEFDECFIQFGNGLRGRIPTPYLNGIMADYRIGGGTIGNVQANTITDLEESIPFVKETFNPFLPVVAGKEKESLEEIKYNAPANFRVRDRAVTEKDYEDLMKLNFYEVLATCGLKNDTNPLQLDLYYLMRQGFNMTPDLEQRIQDFFLPRRMIGTQLVLINATPMVMNITATLFVDKDYYTDVIEQEVKDFITDDIFAEGEFVFRTERIKSDLEQEIVEAIDGARSFRISIPSDDILQAPENQYYTLGTLNITATGGKA